MRFLLTTARRSKVKADTVSLTGSMCLQFAAHIGLGKSTMCCSHFKQADGFLKLLVQGKQSPFKGWHFTLIICHRLFHLLPSQCPRFVKKILPHESTVRAREKHPLVQWSGQWDRKMVLIFHVWKAMPNIKLFFSSGSHPALREKAKSQENPVWCLPTLPKGLHALGCSEHLSKLRPFFYNQIQL